MYKKLTLLKDGFVSVRPKKGAYAESVGIGSIQIHILKPFPKVLLSFGGSLSRLIQSDIVKEHLT